MTFWTDYLDDAAHRMKVQADLASDYLADMLDFAHKHECNLDVALRVHEAARELMVSEVLLDRMREVNENLDGINSNLAAIADAIAPTDR